MGNKKKQCGRKLSDIVRYLQGLMDAIEMIIHYSLKNCAFSFFFEQGRTKNFMGF